MIKQSSASIELVRWLGVVLVVAPAAGCFPGLGCPVDGQQTVAVDDVRLVTLANRADGGAGDAGSGAAITTVTAANCMQVCAAVLVSMTDATLTSCTPTQTDAGESAAECHYTTPCG